MTAKVTTWCSVVDHSRHVQRPMVTAKAWSLAADSRVWRTASGTWWTTAHQYLTLTVVNGYVLPVVMKFLCHITGSVPMDVGHLPLLAWLSGTLCPRTCGIRRFPRTVTGSHWRCFYLRSTSVFSALEVFFTRVRYINPHLIFDCTASVDEELDRRWCLAPQFPGRCRSSARYNGGAPWRHLYRRTASLKAQCTQCVCCTVQDC